MSSLGCFKHRSNHNEYQEYLCKNHDLHLASKGLARSSTDTRVVKVWIQFLAVFFFSSGLVYKCLKLIGKYSDLYIIYILY